MLIDQLIFWTCSLAISLLGLLIFVRNPSLADNRRFAYLSAGLVLWTAFNFLSDNATSHVLFFTRLTFLGGVLAIYSLMAFLANFPTRNVFQGSVIIKIFRIFTVVLLPITITPFFIESVRLTGTSHGSIKISYLYPLFLVYVAFALAVLMIAVRKQTVAAKTSTQKRQVSLVSKGIIAYALLAMLSNVALPLLSDDWSTSRFGPIFTLIFVGTIGYMIVKHRLFDIRLVVARSLGYVLSLAALGGIFAVLTFSLTDLLFHNSFEPQTKTWIYTLFAIGLAFIFPRMKLFFDKITNRLFYRDAYDPQALFDELNKVLVSSLDIEYLMHQSTSIMARYLRTQYCVIGLHEGEGEFRAFGTEKRRVSPKALATLRKLTSKIPGNIIVADVLEEVGHADLLKTLRSNDAAMLVRLTPNVHRKEEGLGYIVLGVKKSGNPYSHQDVRTLEAVANELVLAIQNALHFEEIQKFNEVLQAKVNEATRKYRATNEKLKALDETKDDFISMASHQLRTPLTSVKGYLSMVLEGDAGAINETQKKMLGQAFVSSQRMVYLIADLLNVSRLKTGKFLIEATPTSLADMVSEELDQLVETAAARDITLSYDKPKDFPKVMLDETKTRQVIMNFVDNAIYYTKAGGSIRVELEETPTSIELKVVDNGIGVPKAEQHHLFTKFYRAGNARKARPDGTGLGLYMAKKVVLAQGGSIIFESKEGKGSTFGFLFPKGHTAAVKPLPVAVTSKNA